MLLLPTVSAERVWKASVMYIRAVKIFVVAAIVAMICTIPVIRDEEDGVQAGIIAEDEGGPIVLVLRSNVEGESDIFMTFHAEAQVVLNDGHDYFDNDYMNFYGWGSTQFFENGLLYRTGETITVTEDTELYALWVAPVAEDTNRSFSEAPWWIFALTIAMLIMYCGLRRFEESKA